MPVYTEAGRGRKECPKCHSYVGARSAQCEKCGAEFGASTRTVADAVGRPLAHGIMRVGIPSGECPVELKGIDTETVLTWAHKVRAIFDARHQFLEVSGLVYFARFFYDINGISYKHVRDTLRTHLAEAASPEDEGNEFATD